MLLIWSQVQCEDLGDEGTCLPHLGGVGGDSSQGISVRVELLLQADHHDVHLVALGLVAGEGGVIKHSDPSS